MHIFIVNFKSYYLSIYKYFLLVVRHGKKLERHDSFGSNSSQGSNSSCTPFYPKKKRKILTSRSTKNIRQMRTSSSVISNDFLNFKKVRNNANKLKTSFRGLISSKPAEKRKYSTSSDEENSSKQFKRNTGLSSVLSELRFNSSENMSNEMRCRSSLLFSSGTKTTSEDSVFFNSPTNQVDICNQSEIHEKKFEDNDALMEVINQKRLHSSLLEEKVNKKNVNFCVGSSSLTEHAEVISGISLRGLSDCSSIASHVPLQDVDRLATANGDNAVLLTPDISKQSSSKIQSVSSSISDFYCYIL